MYCVGDPFWVWVPKWVSYWRQPKPGLSTKAREESNPTATPKFVSSQVESFQPASKSQSCECLHPDISLIRQIAYL